MKEGMFAHHLDCNQHTRRNRSLRSSNARTHLLIPLGLRVSSGQFELLFSNVNGDGDGDVRLNIQGLLISNSK